MNTHEWMSDRIDELEAELRLARDEAEIVNRQLAETAKILAAIQDRLDAAEVERDGWKHDAAMWKLSSDTATAALAATQERLEAADERVEELETEAETISADFEKECTAAVRRLLQEFNYDFDLDGWSADDAETFLNECFDDAERRLATMQERLDAAEVACQQYESRADTIADWLESSEAERERLVGVLREIRPHWGPHVTHSVARIVDAALSADDKPRRME